MNKGEIIKLIYKHFEDKDVGVAMLNCISEHEQVEKLAEELEQLSLFGVSNSFGNMKKEDCEYYCSDQCDCMGKWCEYGK